MAQYTSTTDGGTISTTAGANTLTGTDTSWLANVSAGDEILIGDDTVSYTIDAVASDTAMTLTANYPTTRTNETTWIVFRDFTAAYGLPLVNQGDLRFADIYSRAMRLIDNALAQGTTWMGMVIDRTNAAPGTGLSDGDQYLVTASVASGDLWFGYEDYLAVWNAATVAWDFSEPADGFLVLVDDEDLMYAYDNGAWSSWSTNLWSFSGDSAGLGTSAPLENVAGGTADYTGDGVHILTANIARNITEGDGAGLYLIDTGGSADTKILGLFVNNDFAQFLSQNDDLTNHELNILTMDLDNGRVGMGIAATSAAARLHIDMGTADGIPALRLQQDDEDQPFIRLDGTTDTDLSKNLTTQGNAEESTGGQVPGPDYSDGWRHHNMALMDIGGAAVWVATYTHT